MKVNVTNKIKFIILKPKGVIKNVKKILLKLIIINVFKKIENFYYHAKNILKY